jgi:hypothetical protein
MLSTSEKTLSDAAEVEVRANTILAASQPMQAGICGLFEIFFVQKVL